MATDVSTNLCISHLQSIVRFDRSPGFSKRQSTCQSPTTVRIRTPVTQMILFNQGTFAFVVKMRKFLREFDRFIVGRRWYLLCL